MKVSKLLVGLWCFVGFALTASSASALTITLSDLNADNQTLNNGNSQYTGTWNLTADTDWAANVAPATSLAGWNIDSAKVTFVISDDNNTGQTDKVDIYLGGVRFLNDTSGPLDWSQTWTSDVLLGSGTLFGSISASGTLSYTVVRTGGVFVVNSAELTVVATKQVVAAVPDGGATVAMLGLGILGLGVLRREFAA